VPSRDLRRQFCFVLHERKHRSAAIAAWLELCAGAAP